MTRGAGALVSLALSAGTIAHPAAACPTAEQGFRRLASPEAEIAYRWAPPALKAGQFFTAEVVTCRTRWGEAVHDIKIDAAMPAHGHGMNYRPSAVAIAPGHYRFTGLMLHMPGTWRITIDLLQGGRHTRLTHEVDLSP
ncbi:MAG: FixH family protein [Hyphomonadaceae bacterium]|nr:FixH family protein [Hyphomonadaceae bacterium]